ncbi:hypothetical protein ACFV23_09875 [Streptomyces sp. NPDC059627]
MDSLSAHSFQHGAWPHKTNDRALPPHLAYVIVQDSGNLLQIDAVALVQLFSQLPQSAGDVSDSLKQIGIRLE